MSTEQEIIDSTNENALEQYGVWVKKAPDNNLLKSSEIPTMDELDDFSILDESEIFSEVEEDFDTMDNIEIDSTEDEFSLSEFQEDDGTTFSNEKILEEDDFIKTQDKIDTDKNDNVDNVEKNTIATAESLLSAELLNKIVSELSGLRQEISQFKSELTQLKQESPSEKKSAEGFFNDDEADETIALSGDELDTILTNAEFTSDEQSTELSENDDIDLDEFQNTESAELNIQENELKEPKLDDIDFKIEDDMVEELPDEIDIPVFDNLVVDSSEVDLLDSSDSADNKIFNNLPSEDAIEKLLNNVSELTPSDDDIEDDLSDSDDITYSIEDLLNDVDDSTTDDLLNNDDIEDVLREIDGDDDSTTLVDDDIEDVPSDDDDEPSDDDIEDVLSDDDDTPSDDDIEDLPSDGDIEDVLREIDGDDDNEPSDDDIEDLPSDDDDTPSDGDIEDVLREIDGDDDSTTLVDDDIEDLPSDDDSTTLDGDDHDSATLDEVDDTTLHNLLNDVDGDDITLEDLLNSDNNAEDGDNFLDELESEDDISIDDNLNNDISDRNSPINTVLHGNQWGEENKLENVSKRDDVATDDLYIDNRLDSQVTEDNTNQQKDIPPNMREDIKSVLLYMDQLLENLPEEKISEFAQSEYFNTYKKLFTDLGIS